MSDRKSHRKSSPVRTLIIISAVAIFGIGLLAIARTIGESIFQDTVVDGNGKNFNTFKKDLSVLGNYQIPFDKLSGGQKYNYHFEGWQDHSLVVRVSIDSQKEIELNNGSTKWENNGCESFPAGVKGWSFDPSRKDLLYHKIDNLNCFVYDKKNKFLYFTQFST